MVKANNYNALSLGLHLAISTLYLLLANLQGEYLYILYFGSEALFFGLGLIFALTCIDKTYTYLHIAFVWVRGLIYILHYSEIYQTENLERLIYVSFFSLIFVIKYYFYEYFKNKFRNVRNR